MCILYMRLLSGYRNHEAGKGPNQEFKHNPTKGNQRKVPEVKTGMLQISESRIQVTGAHGIGEKRPV